MASVAHITREASLNETHGDEQLELRVEGQDDSPLELLNREVLALLTRQVEEAMPGTSMEHMVA